MKILTLLARNVQLLISLVALGPLLLSLAGCSTSGGTSIPTSSQSLGTLPATTISVAYIENAQPTSFWKERLEGSAKVAERILATDEFAQQLTGAKMKRTNGRSSAQVCRHLQFAGPITVTFGFYENRHTSAIAYESKGVVYINTAREDAAGLPGNVAHELSHQLGYTHWSNWEFLGKDSVPYVVGRIVEGLAQPQSRP